MNMADWLMQQYLLFDAWRMVTGMLVSVLNHQVVVMARALSPRLDVSPCQAGMLDISSES